MQAEGSGPDADVIRSKVKSIYDLILHMIINLAFLS